MIESIVIFLLASLLKADDRKGCGNCCTGVGIPVALFTAANITETFAPISFGNNFVADDAMFNQTSDGSYLISSEPFTLFYQPGPEPILDHYKAVLESLDTFALPTEGILEVEFIAQVEVTKAKLNETPFCGEDVAQNNDVRFGNAGFMTYDAETHLGFGFYMTNDRVYGVYQRVPLDGNVPQVIPHEAAFVYVYPLNKRKRAMVNKLRIALDSKYGTATWYVDGDRRYRIGHIGQYDRKSGFLVQDFGGVDIPVFPQSISILVGTFTLLDYYPVCKDVQKCEYPAKEIALVSSSATCMAPKMYNPLCGPPAPVVYFDPVGQSPNMHIWGQGVALWLDSITVSTRPSCN